MIDPSRRGLYRAAWVLPVSAPPIRDGAVLVDAEGRIESVGPEDAVQGRAGDPVVDLGEAILLPGLINVHGHAELAMLRGALESLPFQEWIGRLLDARRTVLTEGDHLHAARWTAIEALRAGITTLACTESSGGAAVGALTEAGMRGFVFQEVFGPDPDQADASLADLRASVERLREQTGDLVRIGVSPHAPFSVSDRLYGMVTEFAIADALPMAVHIAESVAERELVTRGRGEFADRLNARGLQTPVRARSPIALLDRLGVLRARPLLIHCVDVDGDDIRRIGDSGSPVAHCPIANAKLGHGVAPLQRLRRGGVTVGLGTDSVASNNRMDILEEARMAALIHRARLRDCEAPSNEELLRLCTIEGARALGIDDRVGALQPGMDADLCAVSIAAPYARPVHDPLATLFHSVRGNDVVLSVVRGRILLADGRVTTLDEGATGRAMDDCAERLRAANPETMAR